MARSANRPLRIAISGISATESTRLEKHGVDVTGLLYLRDGKPSDNGRIWPFAEFKKCGWVQNASHDIPDDLVDAIQYAKSDFLRCFHRWSWSHELISDFGETEDLFFSALYNSFFWLTRAQPDLLVFSNVPHEGALVVLYEVAKAMGIPTLVFWQGTIKGRTWLFDHWSDLGHFESTPKNEAFKIDLSVPTAQPFYMAKNKIGRQLPTHNLRGVFVYSAKSFFYALLPGKKRLPAFRRNMAKFALARENVSYLHEREALFSGTLEELKGKKFVYLPLHLEPEMEVDKLGGIYGNQVDVVRRLRQKLPDEVVIAVKDNPKQDSRKRGASFFAQLRSLPNVLLVNSNVPSLELISQSVATATICGTAGWEALRMGKPVIVFGYAFWNRLPGAYLIDDPWNFSDIETYQKDNLRFERAVSDVSKFAWPGIVDHDYIRSLEHFDAEENSANIAKAILAFAKHNKITAIN